LNSDNVSVIDGATNTVLATVPAGDGAGAVAVNTSTNAIYVANFNDNTVTVIDGLTNTVVTTIIPAGGSPFPTGIGVSSLNNSIYVAELGIFFLLFKKREKLPLYVIVRWWHY